MSNVSEWSTTAANNNDSPPDGWPEGMARSAVNDCAREMMAALSKWYKDTLGALVTTGGTTAYTLTTTHSHAVLSDIPMMAIQFNLANTGAVTLAVDGLAARAVTKAQGVALVAGDLAVNRTYLLIYNAGQTRFEIQTALNQDVFPSTTSMVFRQTSAPTGWTKQTTSGTFNNRALRTTTGTVGSGGTTGFTTVFGARTILSGNLPAHTHNSGTYDVGTTINNGSTVTRGFSKTMGTAAVGGGQNVVTNVSWSDDTLSLASGDVSGSSGDGPGTDTALDFDVLYIDVIIANKD